MYRTSVTLLMVSMFAVTTTRAQSAQAPFDVMDKTIPQLQAAMDSGAVTSAQLVRIYLDRITLSYAAREALLGGTLMLRVYRDNGIEDISLQFAK